VMANSGCDFLGIEMQHSPLTFQEVARMIGACRDAPAIPFIRVPDAAAGVAIADDIASVPSGVDAAIAASPVSPASKAKRTVHARMPLLYSRHPCSQRLSVACFRTADGAGKPAAAV